MFHGTLRRQDMPKEGDQNDARLDIREQREGFQPQGEHPEVGTLFTKDTS